MHKISNYPLLLLGAGFSLGAVSKSGYMLGLGKDLALQLYENIIIPNSSSLLDTEMEDCDFYIRRGKLIELCDIIHRHGWDKQRNDFISSSMNGCKANITDKESPDYIDFEAVTTYPWPFIFTLNVDDLLENIYEKSGKKYRVWLRNQKQISSDPEGTTIVKLHGCVNHDIEHLVFCRDEYNEFIRPENALLSRFADESFSRDVIVVGTQFQEDDLKNAIGTLADRGYFGKDCHYFFISPGDYNTEIKGWIEKHSNYHHIQWTNRDFLNFLRSNIALNDTKKRLLTGNFFSCWNDELEDARKNNDNNHELYYGRTPQAQDFINMFDIDRISDNSIDINKDFSLKIQEDCNQVFAIVGNSYVGKTTLALRLLSFCESQGYTCYYTRKADFESIDRLKCYIESTNVNERLAVALEDASGCYYKFSDIISEGTRLKKTIIIATSNSVEHYSKSHHLIKLQSVYEYVISERLRRKAVEKVYSRLRGKRQLGELQRVSSSSGVVKRTISEINDFMDVLYFAHHGRRFYDHFQDWYFNKRDCSYNLIFKALVIYLQIGANKFTPSLLCEIGGRLLKDRFDYSAFYDLFCDYLIVEEGAIRLHGVRMFSDIVDKDMSAEEKQNCISIIIGVLGSKTHERDNTAISIMFENVTKSETLLHEIGLSISDCIGILKSVENQCSDLSYYWIQLSILFRMNQQFEEAVNAILRAQSVRGFRTYQIAHADAKNYMAWGIERKRNKKSDALKLFGRGQMILQKLIDNKNHYPDAFGFSVHTYINMTLQFCSIDNSKIDDLNWFYIEQMLDDYVGESHCREKIMVDLITSTRNYARKCGLNCNRISRINKTYMEYPLKSNGSYEIDEMPQTKVI